MSELLGIARFKFHEGKLEEYKRLSAQAMEIVRTKDTGTLQYDTYFNDDQTECMIVERYRDSEAAMEHAANLGHLFGAVLATVSVVHGELLGEPSAELRAKLADSEVPVLFTPYLSMQTPLAGLDAMRLRSAGSQHARKQSDPMLSAVRDLGADLQAVRAAGDLRRGLQTGSLPPMVEP